MSLVTIISDWSKSDYYLATLKGKILSYNTSTTIVDISNDIPPLDVLQGMFILKSTFRHFPEGSIHLFGVASEPLKDEEMVIIQAEGHFFVGLNDGRFVHLFDKLPTIAYALKNQPTFSNFMAADHFVSAIKIIEENLFESMTEKTTLKEEVILRPVISESSIIGRVVYIDSFGNAITNISKAIFEQHRNRRDFAILVQGPFASIHNISRSYNSGEIGAMLAIFNSLGYLELAINQGSIAESEGLSTSSEITIKFL